MNSSLRSSYEPSRTSLRLPVTVLLAAILALGAIAWESYVHDLALGVDHGGLWSNLLHIGRDSLFAFPLAFVAVVGGLRLARRLGLSHLFIRAAAITMVFALLVIPSGAPHAFIDSALPIGGGEEAGHLHDEGSLEEATDVVGLALHGWRDAALGQVVVLPLAAAGLALLDARRRAPSLTVATGKRIPGSVRGVRLRTTHHSQEEG